MLFHEDSTTETFYTFHQEMALLLEFENFEEFDYIFITDDESAIETVRKNFKRSLHLLCCEHLENCMIRNCTYKKNTKKQKDLINLIMGDMAGADSLPEFDKLVGEGVPSDAFNGNYFEEFAIKLRKFVVEPRLKAPNVIPKFMKSNAIESHNSRIKDYFDHHPKQLDDGVNTCKEMVDDIMRQLMMALIDEGIYRLAPGSKIKKPNKTSWKHWDEDQRYRFFIKAVCTRKTIQGTKPCHPTLPDMTDLSMEERKIARATHKQATTKLNEENKKKQYEAALDANLPALNANSHIKKKPYQKTSSAACRTRDMYNHYPKRE